MKLYYDKRLSDPTYYVQMGIRNGKKTTTINIAKIGKHSELLKKTSDPVAYAKEEIKKINEEYKSGKTDLSITVDFNEKLQACEANISKSNVLNIGYFYLQYIMKDLELKEFFKNICEDHKNTFDCYTINRFLTYARILDPGSKYSTWDKLSTYYEKPGFDYQHIPRFMDILADHYSEYIEWLYKKSNNVVKRNTSVLYYDCTNFYFEVEHADEDVIDEVTGELLNYGLRKYGVSKEHRPNPIVEMGLFMDSDGIPITMCLHPGNTNEQVTAVPLEKEILKMIPGAKFIYCADGGLGSYNIRQFNSMGGRAFIVTQSIPKLSEPLKEAIFSDIDYRLLSSDQSVTLEMMKSFNKKDENNLWLYNDRAYKVLNADHVMDLGLYEKKTLNDGRVKKVKSKGDLKQHIIVTFSRKQMEYQREVRKRQVERAKNMIKTKDPEEIKKGPNDVRRFIKRVSTVDEDNNKAYEYILDEEKVKDEEKYDGFYAVATNLSDPAKDILEVAEGRYKIEDCFRVLKTNFSGRPVYHRLPKRIQAHFLTCFTALLVYRLLETKLNRQETHITTHDLIETLKNINVANVHDIEYMALYENSKTLEALNKLIPLDLDHKSYKPSSLNEKIKKILK